MEAGEFISITGRSAGKHSFGIRVQKDYEKWQWGGKTCTTYRTGQPVPQTGQVPASQMGQVETKRVQSGTGGGNEMGQVDSVSPQKQTQLRAPKNLKRIKERKDSGFGVHSQANDSSEPDPESEAPAQTCDLPSQPPQTREPEGQHDGQEHIDRFLPPTEPTPAHPAITLTIRASLLGSLAVYHPEPHRAVIALLHRPFTDLNAPPGLGEYASFADWVAEDWPMVADFLAINARDNLEAGFKPESPIDYLRATIREFVLNAREAAAAPDVDETVVPTPTEGPNANKYKPPDPKSPDSDAWTSLGAAVEMLRPPGKPKKEETHGTRTQDEQEKP